MMDLESAIKHCEEVMMENLEKTKGRNASDPIAINCFECAEEHRQLAEWLKELKAYKVGEGRSEIPNTCGDAISRQAVLDAFWKLNVELSPTAIWTIQNMIKDLPSVTPQQRTGRWIPVGYDGYADGNPVYDWWECSECGWEHTGDEESLTAFCPSCGTKMEVD